MSRDIKRAESAESAIAKAFDSEVSDPSRMSPIA